MNLVLTAPEAPESGRHKLDAYYTPPALAEAICSWLAEDGWWHGGRVLEPSAGKGAFLDAVLYGGLQPTSVDAIELDEARAGELARRYAGLVRVQQGDFTTEQLHDPYELIVGNPPFHGAEEHVRRALSWRSRFGAAAFLLRLAFLESKERLPFWAEHPASQVYVLSERPSFTGGGTDNSAYGVFVWASWHRGPTELEIKSWKAGRRA